MLDAGREYSLQQTLDEHSSSITAVKFAGGDWGLRLPQSSTYPLAVLVWSSGRGDVLERSWES